MVCVCMHGISFVQVLQKLIRAVKMRYDLNVGGLAVLEISRARCPWVENP
ncbi:hypothetical protein LguiA_000048 [Lonicera macranthoides]